jgi:hypothetical protein
MGCLINSSASFSSSSILSVIVVKAEVNVMTRCCDLFGDFGFTADQK